MAGEFAGRMTAASAGALALNTAFSSLTNRVLRVNESLAQYNGQIAAAVGAAQAAQINRQIRQGEIIAPAYERLDESQQHYRDMMTEITAPMQAAGMQFQASVNELRNNIVAYIAPTLTAFTESLNDFVEWWTGAKGGGGNTSTATAGRAFLSDLSDGKFDGLGTSYMNPGNRPLYSAADRRRIFGP